MKSFIFKKPSIISQIEAANRIIAMGSGIFHPQEVVSRYRDLQLHVDENYQYLFI